MVPTVFRPLQEERGMSSSLCLTQPVPIRPALTEPSTRDCLELQTRDFTVACPLPAADEHAGRSCLLRDYPGLPKDVNIRLHLGKGEVIPCRN